VTLRVDGLSCPFCAYGMEKKLKRIENMEKLDIKINEGLVILFFKEGAKVDKQVISKKVKEAGFTPREITIERPVAKSDVISHKVTLNIEGMRCQGCVSRVEAALNKVECTQQVSVNLEKNEANVVCNGDEKDQKKLVETVEKLGFKARLVEVSND
ncbi:MAG: cation transporter, partial [bacterium]